MAYPIKEELLSYNRPHTLLKPQGFVIHATATPGATAQNEHDYFNRAYRGASAHYFVDWHEIIRTIPENEMAWHAGPTANQRFLSVEMCEPAGHDPNKFQEVWNRTVWLVAEGCVRYGWSAAALWSHKMVSDKWHETNHTDPLAYLESYNRTWDDLVQAVENEIRGLKEAPLPAGVAPVPIQVGGRVLTGVIINGHAYAPVKALGEALGWQVVWDEKRRMVLVTIPPH